MAGNSNLHDSMRNKQDEFYTELSLIEDELLHYKEHFKNKVILCNCDDPYESNFFKYFALNFNTLGLKKLITTCYSGSPISGTELNLFPDLEPQVAKKQAYKLEITELSNVKGEPNYNLNDVQRILKENQPEVLKGNGDFRSDECIKFLKEADIVVTNPPFSLFREFVTKLVEYEKEFLIVGNLNAVTYKEILPLIMQNKIWIGYNNGHFWFKVPQSYEIKKTDFKIDDNGQKWRRMGNICWYTNLDIEKRHENILLFREYNPKDYPTYDNYNAIEVSRAADIPKDYDGIMGVPITFLNKYNPEQFDLLGIDKDFTSDGGRFTLVKSKRDIRRLYARLVVRRKN